MLVAMETQLRATELTIFLSLNIYRIQVNYGGTLAGRTKCADPDPRAAWALAGETVHTAVVVLGDQVNQLIIRYFTVLSKN